MSVSEKAKTVRGVNVIGPEGPRHGEVLTNEALAFLADLHRRFARAGPTQGRMW